MGNLTVKTLTDLANLLNFHRQENDNFHREENDTVFTLKH